jgi:hypothetical protein
MSATPGTKGLNLAAFKVLHNRDPQPGELAETVNQLSWTPESSVQPIGLDDINHSLQTINKNTDMLHVKLDQMSRYIGGCLIGVIAATVLLAGVVAVKFRRSD